MCRTVLHTALCSTVLHKAVCSPNLFKLALVILPAQSDCLVVPALRAAFLEGSSGGSSCAGYAICTFPQARCSAGCYWLTHKTHTAFGCWIIPSGQKMCARACVYTWVGAAVTAPVLPEHRVNWSACCHGAEHQNSTQNRNKYNFLSCLMQLISLLLFTLALYSY